MPDIGVSGRSAEDWHTRRFTDIFLGLAGTRLTVSTIETSVRWK